MKYLLFLVLLTTVLIAGCKDDSSDIMATRDPAVHLESTLEILRENIGATEIQDLTEAEIAGLVFMREEEKLARDVYLNFADQYDMNIFGNIAPSEQMHMDAVLLLLDRYEIADPAGENPIGVFQNDALQALYDDLIAQGGQSLEDALYVGCAIEEIDILDLVNLMDRTSYKDLLLVYQHLLDGSGNHMRAYVPRWEEQTGLDYEPRFMSVEDFEEIMSAEGSGGGGGGHGHGGGGRRN